MKPTGHNSAGRHRVSLAACDAFDYNQPRIAAAVSKAVEAIGGIERFVPHGSHALVKINQLGRYAAEKAINTHPAVLAAALDLLLPVAGRVVVGDGLIRTGHEQFACTGADAVCRSRGVELVNFKDEPYENVEVNGKRLKRIPIARAARRADVIVNLPKLKTHSLTLMTAALKNGYGFLPQNARANYHKRFFVPSDFAEAMVDIYQAAIPSLNIMDAVVGLEGYGPGSKGVPRPIGAIVAGGNAVAVDVVGARLIGLRDGDVSSTLIAAGRGLGPAFLRGVELCGDRLAPLMVSDFSLPDNAVFITRVVNRMPESASRLVGQVVEALRGQPVASADLCIACGQCVHHCPVKAVRIENKVAVFDEARCIRCFCCQEFCPVAAIGIKMHPLTYGLIALKKTIKAIRHIGR